MGMVVRTNTMAQNAFRQLNMNNSAVSKSLEKLASGYRINRAGDDAAGLAISEKMKAQIKGLETAATNAQDGISLIQTAEGALTEVHNMLNRMVELATKSANGTYSITEREALQQEVDSLLDEVDRISQSTNFNGINLLDGTLGFNDKAFSINELAAVEAKPKELTVEGAVDDNAFARTATANATAEAINTTEVPGELHFTKDTSEVKPSFTIDLADIVLEGVADGGGTAKITIASGEVNNSKLELDTGAIAKGEQISGQALAQSIFDAQVGETLSYAGADYEMQVDGSKLTFTFLKDTAGSTTAVTDDVKSPSGTVSVASNQDNNADTVKILSGSHNHAVEDVVNPKKGEAGGRAGITFNLATDEVVTDGNRLTIDGTTFVFKTSTDSAAAAGDGEILIDVSGVTVAAGGDLAAAQRKEAVDLMSKHETANFTIHVKDGDKIHIDQKVNNKNVYKDRNSLTSLFTLETGGQAAATTVTLKQDELEVGNSLTIGGKQYTFGKNISIGASANDTLNNLKAALYEDGLTARVSGSTITVYSNNADSEAGPSIIGGGLTLQIGDTGDEFNMMTVSVADMGSRALGLSGLDITTADSARASIDDIRDAINAVSTNRAGMGALQNRLDYTINSLNTSVENLSAANSRIRDTDMAKEMMAYTQMNILTQAAQSMLAQANQQPQAILQLLQ